LQEREMIKLASLAGDVAEALRLRGVHDPAAILTDDAGITVFAVAVDRLARVRRPGAARRSGHPAVEVLRLPAFVRIGRAVVVDVRGRPLGMLSVTDVQRTLRACDLVAA
jgi:hypothetical protein